jgi:hypothetical protein
LPIFRRCQDLEPEIQIQVLRFNREIGKRVIDTNILTSQARNEIQVQGELQLVLFRFVHTCAQLLESKGDSTGTTLSRRLDDVLKTHAKRFDSKAHCDPFTAISKSLGYTPVIGQLAFDLLIEIFHKKGDHKDSTLIAQIYAYEYRAPSGTEAQIAVLREMLANAKATVMAPVLVIGETPRPHPAVHESLIVDSFIAALEFSVKTGLDGYPKELRDLERLAQLFREVQLRLGDKILFADLLVIVTSEVAKGRCGPLPGFQAKVALAAQKSQALSVPSPPPPPPPTTATGTAAMVKFLKMHGPSGSELLCADPKSKKTYLKLNQLGSNVVSIPPDIYDKSSAEERHQLRELRRISKIYHGLEASVPPVNKSRTPDKSNSKGQSQGKGYQNRPSTSAKGQSRGKGWGKAEDRGKGSYQQPPVQQSPYQQPPHHYQQPPHHYQQPPHHYQQPPFAKIHGKGGSGGGGAYGSQYTPQPRIERGKGGHSRTFAAEVSAPRITSDSGENARWAEKSSVQDTWQDQGGWALPPAHSEGWRASQDQGGWALPPAHSEGWRASQDQGGASAPKNSFMTAGHDPGHYRDGPRLPVGRGDPRYYTGPPSYGEDEVAIRRSQHGRSDSY